VRITLDVIYDQLIGSGCADRLTFSWGGNPGVGSLHRFRDAVARGWPAPLELEKPSRSDLATAYVAGASNLPFAVLRGYEGSSSEHFSPHIRSITCPFTGEKFAATPSVRPDVTVVIHAQKADRSGNVLLWGILGVQKEAVLAARRSIVTVEEQVDSLNATPNACVLPPWVVNALFREAQRLRMLPDITIGMKCFISNGTPSRETVKPLLRGSGNTFSIPRTSRNIYAWGTNGIARRHSSEPRRLLYQRRDDDRVSGPNAQQRSHLFCRHRVSIDGRQPRALAPRPRRGVDL
jgi:acyl CoA:acetate/3-ketoacid CoA transferase alpha subunit